MSKHSETIADVLIDAIIRDANQIEVWTRKGYKRYDAIIAGLKCARQEKLDALEHLKAIGEVTITDEELRRLEVHGEPLDRAALKALRSWRVS